MDLVLFLAPLKLIHVLAALAFVMAHGTSAAVSLRLRGLRDRATILAYLDLSERTMGATYASLLVVFVGGIISGIAGGYWTSGRLWLWASMAVFMAIALEMSFVRWRYLLRVRTALGIAQVSALATVRHQDPTRSLRPPSTRASRWSTSWSASVGSRSSSG